LLLQYYHNQHHAFPTEWIPFQTVGSFPQSLISWIFEQSLTLPHDASPWRSKATDPPSLLPFLEHYKDSTT